MVIVLALGTTFAGSAILQSTRSKTNTAFLVTGQALELANAGITEATSWFRRQPTQPVTTFAPQLDLTVTPEVLDTDEPEIGLVREFSISGKYWGRYEVWREWAADPDPARLATRQRLQLRDVSAARGKSSAGSSWLLRSIGYVFVRNDPNVGFDERPNRILASEVLETEINRFALALPAKSAAISAMGGPFVVHTDASIDGGSTASGIYYKTGNGDPNVAGTVLGTPDLATAPTGFDDTLETMMGLSEEELKGMADQVVSKAKDFPDFIAETSIIYCDAAKVVLDSTKPLRGVGILYCEGNLSIKPGGIENFDGLIIVRGQTGIDGPGRIRGSLLGRKGINLAGDLTIEFSEETLSKVMNTIGTYRISRSVRSLRTGD